MSLDQLLQRMFRDEPLADRIDGTPLFDALQERAAEARTAHERAFRDPGAVDLAEYRKWRTAIGDLQRFGWRLARNGIERI